MKNFLILSIPVNFLELTASKSTKLLLHKGTSEPLYFVGGRRRTRRRLKSDTDKGHPRRKPRSAKPLT
jgi:hypothetical protein